MDEQVSEFEVAYTIRSRHGRLFKLVEEFGSIEALAKAIGVSAGTLGTWVNLQAKPGRKAKRGVYIKPAVRRAVKKLCQLAKCSAEELFPGWLDKEKLDRLRLRATKIASVSHSLLEHTNQTKFLSYHPDDSQIADPESVVEERDRQSRLKELLSNQLRFLTKQQNLVIKMRISEGKTLDQCAKILNVTMERVRQIEVRAIRKLSANVELRKFFEDHYEVKRPVNSPPLSSTEYFDPTKPGSTPPTH